MIQNNAARFPTHHQPEFFKTLRARVEAHFAKKGISRFGNAALFAKTAILYVLFLGSFLAILFIPMPSWAMLLGCVAMGIGGAGLGMNVMHDAHHGSYSSHKGLNNFIGYTMEVLGGSSLTWKIQHNLLHHTYPNVYGYDEDIHDKPFIRLSPDGKWKPWHRFQHIYAFLLYGLSTFAWVLRKDFTQFRAYSQRGLLRQIGAHPVREVLKMSIGKTLFVAVTIIFPFYWLSQPWWAILGGMLLVHFVMGLILTTVFLTAHAVEQAEHFQPDSAGNLENNWAIHQLCTTANFRVRNPLLAWYVGGLHHQVEHHLFPGISHVHYPEIAPIVRATSREFGIPYLEYDSFFEAVASHFRYLRDVGRRPESLDFGKA